MNKEEIISSQDSIIYPGDINIGDLAYLNIEVDVTIVNLGFRRGADGMETYFQTYYEDINGVGHIDYNINPSFYVELPDPRQPKPGDKCKLVVRNHLVEIDILMYDSYNGNDIITPGMDKPGKKLAYRVHSKGNNLIQSAFSRYYLTPIVV